VSQERAGKRVRQKKASQSHFNCFLSFILALILSQALSLGSSIKQTNKTQTVNDN